MRGGVLGAPQREAIVGSRLRSQVRRKVSNMAMGRVIHRCAEFSTGISTDKVGLSV